ncbi:MAG: ATP-dependent helicase [bacterium]|nr:ATP-dependent helicase [bacterium]
MPSTSFEQILTQLNPAQRLAVETIDGPVMVLAGPGTGKTQVLAARIAHILRSTDTNPSSVLALTFTESAAKNMKQRLVSMIGKTGYYVQIHTFHSFCTEVINSHPEYFPLDRESQPLTELERFAILESVIDSLELSTLRPINAPYFYLKDLIKAISDLKKEGISPLDFNGIVEAEQSLMEQEQDELKKTELSKRQKMIAKNTELQKIYQAYQEQLQLSTRYDFDDMISLVVGAFSAEENLLSEYQERLQYFLVDEYQDTNSAQNKVVDLLASYWGEQANVFVVGDPNQAIYRFQGASLENVLSFTVRYKQATVITLDTGYRSPQIIYDAAALLIGENTSTATNELFSTSLSQTLKSVKDEIGKIEVFPAPSQSIEAIYIALKIQALIAGGAEPSAIAVLYRNNGDATDIAMALEKWGIAYEIDGGDNVLEAEHIRQFITLLKVISSIKDNGEDEGLLYEVLQYEWVVVPKLLVMQAVRVAKHSKCSLFEILQQGYEAFITSSVVKNATEAEFTEVKLFVDQVVSWATKDSQLTFVAWFELLLSESGYLPWLMKQDTKIEKLNQVNSLFREVKAASSTDHEYQLSDFLAMIATLQEHKLAISAEDLNVSHNAVKLSTVHKAKGQEWEYVFLAKCIDGKWGNGTKRELLPLPSSILRYSQMEKKERNEDERRLFYVALTRVKKELTISYPETIITENRSRSVVNSLFIEEVRPFLSADTSSIATQAVAEADQHLLQLLEPAPTRNHSNEEKAFFSSLVTDFRLSATTLNTYLRSPEEFKLKCLLQVPEAKSPTLAFGTAVHTSLERVFNHYQLHSTLPPIETFLSHFEEALSKEALHEEELALRLKYGQEVLTRYYQQCLTQDFKPLFVERTFGTGWSKTILGDVVLSGRVDRVDWIDTSAKTVRVIDYKTGKARTAGEIEGKTVSAELSPREQQLPESVRGRYKRQLLFYKLLTELDQSFVPIVREGVFEFIEPDKQSGKLISRSFILEQEDVEELKVLIKDVMTEIRQLSFLSTSI